MKIKVKKVIGDSSLEFEVDEPKPLDALGVAGFLCETPNICTVCGSNEVRLSMNKADGYTFVKVKCKCGASAQLGQYNDGGYFWKRFEMYVPNDKDFKQ